MASGQGVLERYMHKISSCASVPGSSRGRPLTRIYPPILATLLHLVLKNTDVCVHTPRTKVRFEFRKKYLSRDLQLPVQGSRKWAQTCVWRDPPALVTRHRGKARTGAAPPGPRRPTLRCRHRSPETRPVCTARRPRGLSASPAATPSGQLHAALVPLRPPLRRRAATLRLIL